MTTYNFSHIKTLEDVAIAKLAFQQKIQDSRQQIEATIEGWPATMFSGVATTVATWLGVKDLFGKALGSGSTVLQVEGKAGWKRNAVNVLKGVAGYGLSKVLRLLLKI